MGESQRKLVAQKQLLAANKMVTIDLAEVAFAIPDPDRRALKTEGVDENLGAARHVINLVIGKAFPNGINRREGRLWAAWQEVIAGNSTRMEVTQGQLEWLRQQFSAESLEIPHNVAQWREALCEYLEQTLAPVAEKESNGASVGPH